MKSDPDVNELCGTFSRGDSGSVTSSRVVYFDASRIGRHCGPPGALGQRKPDRNMS